MHTARLLTVVGDVQGRWMGVSRGVTGGGGGVHPLVNRITDRCKNITFSQLRLWAVIKAYVGKSKINSAKKKVTFSGN